MSLRAAVALKLKIFWRSFETAYIAFKISLRFWEVIVLERRCHTFSEDSKDKNNRFDKERQLFPLIFDYSGKNRRISKIFEPFIRHPSPSPVVRHPASVTRHTSPINRHPSPVNRQRPVTLGILVIRERCPMSDVRHLMATNLSWAWGI